MRYSLVGVLIRAAIVGRKRLASDPIAPVGPSRQILVAAALAAEGTPSLVLALSATQHAQSSLVHPTYSSPD